jgi:hypothetical protein
VDLAAVASGITSRAGGATSEAFANTAPPANTAPVASRRAFSIVAWSGFGFGFGFGLG